MEKKLTVDVCLSPQLYPAYEREDTIVVVIDVLRATSAMCTAFEFGVDKMIPVATLEEAMEYKDIWWVQNVMELPLKDLILEIRLIVT